MLEVNKIHHGDCIEVMKTFPDNSIDHIITDPPYCLTQQNYGFERGEDSPFKRTAKGGFMGKLWDNDIALNHSVWKEAFRILKSGGYLLAFGGTRTYHRLTCAIEDSGFQIRDCMMWLYGSGFPKSLNIGKKSGNKDWEGWGTALKPAWEPIIMAMKPVDKNFCNNALTHGIAGLNIDACRINGITNKDKIKRQSFQNIENLKKDNGMFGVRNKHTDFNSKGRFPANLILDEEAGKMLDEQSGISSSNKSDYNWNLSKQGIIPLTKNIKSGIHFGDSGGASRFFYTAKASKGERNEGLDDFEEEQKWLNGGGGTGISARENIIAKNIHPTVKPIKLMEYLIKLVTRKEHIVLDPFLGSGSTAVACRRLGRPFIGIEKEAEYVKIAKGRIKKELEQKKLTEIGGKS